MKKSKLPVTKAFLRQYGVTKDMCGIELFEKITRETPMSMGRFMNLLIAYGREKGRIDGIGNGRAELTQELRAAKALIDETLGESKPSRHFTTLGSFGY